LTTAALAHALELLRLDALPPPTASVRIDVGDVVEYKRTGVGVYTCEVVEIDAARPAGAFRLKILKLPNGASPDPSARLFWASHAKIQRIVAIRHSEAEPAPDCGDRQRKHIHKSR
jgi:hypothetical protein